MKKVRDTVIAIVALVFFSSSVCFASEKATKDDVNGQFIYSNYTVQDGKYVGLKLLNDTLQTIPENEKLLKQANVSYGFMWSSLSIMLAGLTAGTVYACLPDETPYRNLMQDISWYTTAGGYLTAVLSSSLYGHYIHLAIDNYNLNLFNFEKN